MTDSCQILCKKHFHVSMQETARNCVCVAQCPRPGFVIPNSSTCHAKNLQRTTPIAKYSRSHCREYSYLTTSLTIVTATAKCPEWRTYRANSRSRAGAIHGQRRASASLQKEHTSLVLGVRRSNGSAIRIGKTVVALSPDNGVRKEEGWRERKPMQKKRLRRKQRLLQFRLGQLPLGICDPLPQSPVTPKKDKRVLCLGCCISAERMLKQTSKD